MANVEVREVSKRYDDVWAARRISFSVAAGSFTSLLGPSGCGKTTTLRLIAGFVEPDEGEVRIGGRAIDALPPWRRNLGVVFQNYALFPFMTVKENVAFGLRRRRVATAEVDERVAAALDLVGLPDLDRRYPRQLSGGQQQRVALARALVVRPEVLLLDEPLSNLDARLRAEMRFELKRIQRETGVTSIFVTHDQEEALTLSDQIVVLDRGRVRATGAPRAMWEEPRSAFVADFLGVENLIPARAAGTDDDGNTRFAIDRFPTPIRAMRAFGTAPGEPVVLGVRASDIAMTRDAGGDGDPGDPGNGGGSGNAVDAVDARRAVDAGNAGNAGSAGSAGSAGDAGGAGNTGNARGPGSTGDPANAGSAAAHVFNEVVGEVREATYIGEAVVFQVRTPLLAAPLVATSREDFAIGERVRLMLPARCIKVLTPDPPEGPG